MAEKGPRRMQKDGFVMLVRLGRKVGNLHRSPNASPADWLLWLVSPPRVQPQHVLVLVGWNNMKNGRQHLDPTSFENNQA